jgi:hypothetical protein
MTLGAGDRLGHYAIVAAIGAGGMGEVYRTRDTMREGILMRTKNLGRLGSH